MKKIAAALAVFAGTIAVSGCYYYPDRYYYDRAHGAVYYDGYYDGYYGPYYGGYWGDGGTFYYYDRDRRAHRDEERHFRHEAFDGGERIHVDRDGDRWRDRDER